ncbi:QueT transporter family protein [Virgibacillus dakarensis]|uniref:Membrane protein n=1 Tax=Lentibacillus populi TaxID=1827502 RepID=A0A9W5X6J9_9BACI|nr:MULTISPECIES: QueT transporter family protein [Bacillaceae]MBT2217005.1 QueT transporter family protein [Virgibacillus dakarensis]MTW86930.1 QueT transporter family protein [Virgibacillus dakarensis]GGB52562.1 membrane protein [Lentibacillus populi]
MKLKTLVINAVIAALYVAVSLVLLIFPPLAFSNVQFRIPEVFNHLVVFNKKYFAGIVTGVLLTNIFSPTGVFDLVFGVAHSALSLGITIWLGKFIKNHLALMIVNTLVFTFNMFIIAFELYVALDFPFLLTWLTTAAGEIVVMAIGIPIMHALNRKVQFGKLV